MKITILDAATLGEDLIPEIPKLFSEYGEVEVRLSTLPEEIEDVTADADVVIVNKIKLSKSNLDRTDKIKLICVTATGYDNIDVEYCKERGIAVCNVVGYSTDSVAQTTVMMALALANRLTEYTRFVKSGEYTKSGIANRLTPVYHELAGKVWGIVGAGNIGKKVAKIAEAFGCRVVVCKRKKEEGMECVDIDTLCEISDIISVHAPLTDETRNLINRERIAKMKNDAIFINVARGAIADEEALADAIKEDRLGGLGIDVYTVEPFASNHPFAEISGNDKVCLTPHNAWGAYEARLRCLDIISDNIKAFLCGEKKNRVDV